MPRKKISALRRTEPEVILVPEAFLALLRQGLLLALHEEGYLSAIPEPGGDI